jgi:hypothetical protein
MKRLSTSLTLLTRRLSSKGRMLNIFGPSIGNFEPEEDETTEEKEEETTKNPNLTNISDENIHKTKELIEDIIFIHNYYELKKLEKPNKKATPISMTFIEYDDLNQELVLDEKEMEGIKTEQILNILKPKIEKYLTYKDLEFNCTFMKNLYSYAEEIGFDNTIGCLFPLIQELTFKKNIDEKIIFSFFEGFDNFLKYLLKYDTDHQITLQKFLPIIEDMLNNKKDIKMINIAIDSLKQIISLMSKEEIQSDLLPLLIRLSSNESNLNARKLSLRIFNENAKILGTELIEIYVIPQLESISEDRDEELRKSCVNNMLNIFESVSYNVLKTKMIRIFQTLSYDDCPAIRKKCCEMLPSMCKISRSELVSQYLLPIYFLFTNDSEEAIRNTALSIYGEFIFYLQREDIKLHIGLLQFYIDQIIGFYDIKKNIINNATLHKCAFSFPSVLLAYYRKVSSKKWNDLKPVYMKFVNDEDPKIKKTIAHSFGEVAKILDPKISETEICPLIINMYKNNSQDIKNIIISILPEYLYSINDKKTKLLFIDLFKTTLNDIKNSKKWRERYNFVKTLGRLINIYDNSTMFNEIFFMCIQLCFDGVSKVRKKAAKNLSKLLLQFLSADDQYKIKALVIIRMFSTCIHYQYRQLFIFMCTKLIEDESLFMEMTYELVEDLSYDNILNVRITLGNFLNKGWNKKQGPFQWIKKNKKILEMIYRLKNDEFDEVKNSLKDINIEDVKKELNYEDYTKIMGHKNVNETFTNKCDELKVLLGFTPDLYPVK